MNLIVWLVLGALAGAAARVILSNSKGVWWQDILLGAAGAAVGGFLASRLGLRDITGLNLYSLLVAVCGACLLLWLISRLRRR